MLTLSIKMLKAIIFDLGSVVFNIDWFTINQEMMKKYNVSTPNKDRIRKRNKRRI